MEVKKVSTSNSGYDISTSCTGVMNVTGAAPPVVHDIHIVMSHLGRECG